MGTSLGLPEQSGDECDQACDDDDAEHIGQNGVAQHRAPDLGGAQRGVGHLVGLPVVKAAQAKSRKPGCCWPSSVPNAAPIEPGVHLARRNDASA